jgi:hypothetical protein
MRSENDDVTVGALDTARKVYYPFVYQAKIMFHRVKPKVVSD